jgi:hypothetical protein
MLCGGEFNTPIAFGFGLVILNRLTRLVFRAGSAVSKAVK